MSTLIHRAVVSLLFLQLGSAGCDFSPFELKAATAIEDAGRADTEQDAAMPAASEEDAGGAGQTEPDAGVPGPIAHDRCASPLPDFLPHEPAVEVDASGRPLFDLYRDVSCDDAQAQPACDNDTSCPDDLSSFCLQLDAEQPGICALGIRDTGRLPFSFGDGSCIAWGTLAVRQQACCSNLPGADCREWPYDSKHKSKPGELCARHQDCEPGLVCSEYFSVGLCSCPDRELEATSCTTVSA